jgi:hypothetical protein
VLNESHHLGACFLCMTLVCTSACSPGTVGNDRQSASLLSGGGAAAQGGTVGGAASISGAAPVGSIVPIGGVPALPVGGMRGMSSGSGGHAGNAVQPFAG